MITIHPFDDELDGVAVDFLFEEVPEPEEMTDDDSDFSPWEIFLDLGGGAYMTNIP